MMNSIRIEIFHVEYIYKQIIFDIGRLMFT